MITLILLNMKIRSIVLATLMVLVSFNLSAEKITLLTDIHVVPGNNKEEMLKHVIEDINNNETEIVVLSGDLTDEGSDEQ